MIIKELKALIADLPDDMEVILQKDGEGNGYSPLSSGEECFYVPENTWSGQVYGLDDEDCMDSEDWQELKEGPKSLVLFPIN